MRSVLAKTLHRHLSWGLSPALERQVGEVLQADVEAVGLLFEETARAGGA